MGQQNQGRYASVPSRKKDSDRSIANSLDFSYYQVPAPQGNNSNVKIISCPGHVFDVIRSFDQRKKDIVRSIGFSGLLHLSRFTEIDPKFTLWLFRKVRWSTRSLHISDSMNFVIMPEHIGKIIGIPYSGIDVSDKAFEDEDDKIAFMKVSLAFLGNEAQLLEAAEAYLALQLPFGFSKEDADKFKVAFVIFVMGRFLAPSLDTSTARSDFWGALKNPDAIHSFNWSSFVLSDIIEASRVVVWNTLRKLNVSVILGCPLILQILYLDIIDTGHLNLTHDVTPRVKHFNSDLLRNMITADYVAEESSPTDAVFGRAKSFRTINTCYNFLSTGCAMTPSSPSTENPEAKRPQIDLHKTNEQTSTSVAARDHPMIQIPPSSYKPALLSINSNLDSDVPDFVGTMREYFQGQVDPSLLECFRFHQAMCLQHFTKFSNGLKAAITKENINLVSKVVNHQRRLSGLSPINLDVNRPATTRRTYDDMLSGAESGDDTTPSSNASKHARILRGRETPVSQKGTPQHRSFIKSVRSDHGPSASLISRDNTSTLEAEANIYGDKFTTPEKNCRKPPLPSEMTAYSPAYENTSLNAERSLHPESPKCPISKKILQPARLAVTHWARNIDHPIRDVALTHSFYDWLSTTTSSDLKKYWIMHDYPRFIQLSGKQLKDYFTDIQPMAHDAFDICVRRIRQLDKLICPKDVHLRWRHLLESDFSMNVLGGENPLNNSSTSHQFGSTYLDYELERCRMFFVPVFVDGRWWCYAWDFKTSTLTINDPSVGSESDALVIQKHAVTIQLLSKSLTETVEQLYTGWHPNFNECNIVVFRSIDMPIESSKSGFFTLFFMKNYNGTNLVIATDMCALQNFKEYMLYEILELKQNQVNPPSAYVQSIDD